MTHHKHTQDDMEVDDFRFRRFDSGRITFVSGVYTTRFPTE